AVCFVHGVNHESWFRGFERGKNNHRKKTDTLTSIGLALESVVSLIDASKSDGTLNEVTLISAVMESVTPTMVDMDVEKENLNSVEDTTVLGSFPPITMQVTTSAGNAPGKGNGIDVVVPVESIRAICDRFANRAYGFFLGKRVVYPVIANYVRNTWGKYGLVRSMFSSSTRLFFFQFSSMDGLDDMLKNGPCDDGLSAITTKLGTPLILDSYTSDMCIQSWGRIKGEGYYTYNIRVEYEWKPPRCACCKVFGYVHEECPKNIGASATKNLKKTSQTPKVILVRQKMGFKPKQVFTSVDYDVDLGTNGGISNSADKVTNNVSSNITYIGEKINKIEWQIYKGKFRFVDDDGNPLVPTGIIESDSEVEVVFDETTNLRISTIGKDGSDKGYGTNSLLE
ncbi:hypothetical protein Tco_1334531, partial [Tanacetum coccineum]